MSHALELRSGEPLMLRSRWDNIGVAPIYHPWPLAYRLRSRSDHVLAQWTSHADVKQWLPGPIPQIEDTSGGAGGHSGRVLCHRCGDSVRGWSFRPCRAGDRRETDGSLVSGLQRKDSVMRVGEGPSPAGYVLNRCRIRSELSGCAMRRIPGRRSVTWSTATTRLPFPRYSIWSKLTLLAMAMPRPWVS